MVSTTMSGVMGHAGLQCILFMACYSLAEAGRINRGPLASPRGDFKSVGACIVAHPKTPKLVSCYDILCFQADPSSVL
jgi:hypothetical protein